MKKLRERGVSVRKMNRILLVLALIASGMLFYAMNRTNRLYDEAQEVTRDRIAFVEKSYDMQRASDYLTEQIRCFVMTGEREYLELYFREVNETRRREKAIDYLEKCDLNEKTVQELKEAMAESQTLMETEIYAARLMAEAAGDDLSLYPEDVQKAGLTEFDLDKTPGEKQDQAGKLLFGEEYREKKEAISSHITECVNRLNTEMMRKEANAESNFEAQVFVEHALTVILIVILLLVVFLTFILMIKPLRNAIESIRGEKEVEPEGAYEVRFLAKTYNLIFQTNKEKREKLTYETTHDDLTGLYNRRGYDYLLKNVDMETAALLLIDMDNYKEIRETGGAETADRALKYVATSLLNLFRSTDYVCRVGDDAFAIIMMHVGNELKELIREKYERLTVEMKNGAEDVPEIRISAGVAFGKNGDNASSIFRMADEALYLARKENKSGIHFQKAE